MVQEQPFTQEDRAAAAPRVPDGSRVYAIGDIHGRADLLERLHAMIREDAATAEGLRKVIVYLGDYVDRGPQSSDVIERLLDQPLPGFEAVHLKGNHEDFLVRFWADGSLGESWMMNGAPATLQSYGLDFADVDIDADPLAAMHQRFRDVLPPRHMEFFLSLDIVHQEGDYLFVHAGLRPGVAIADQKETDLLWIRYEFLGSDADFGKFVVHGHTITPEIEIRPNRLGIDTGAFYTGCLTCLVLEEEERRFLHT